MKTIKEIDKEIRQNAKIEIRLPESQNLNMIIAMLILCISKTKRDQTVLNILFDLFDTKPLAINHIVLTLREALTTKAKTQYQKKLLQRIIQIIT